MGPLSQWIPGAWPLAGLPRAPSWPDVTGKSGCGEEEAEVGGQAAHSGCDGALSLPGSVPDAARCPVSCRSGSISPWTTAAASSRTWTEPWVSSPHREGMERRGGFRQGLSPRRGEGGFLPGGCAARSLASSPGPQRPPGILGQSCMSLWMEKGGSRDQLTEFTQHQGREAACQPGNAHSRCPPCPRPPVLTGEPASPPPLPSTSQLKASWPGGRD